ncbi:type VI secretion system baseplate subunit TssK [Pseudomonas carnis]|uniref:type VI secretion system baseplate subunit TssK n=1 Tax=Pseudomonas carnis TaxID=2487355 RepID=UPI00280B3904|nr:type VI secretion system baseplate subunit TssK [Pseudomonas carnis]
MLPELGGVSHDYHARPLSFISLLNMLLQLVNRAQPLIQHFSQLSPLHPERFFSELVSLAGEFSTFSTSSRRPQEYPQYQHDDLALSFMPVMAALREALSMLIDSKATPIPIVEKAYGIHVAMLADKTLLDNASFILVVRADVPGETLRARFGQQSKVGSVEHIRDMVNLQLPGIGLLPLPVAPRQLPYHAGSTYYELDRGSEHWQQLNNSGGFAFHIAGQFPGLNLAFWAIRG